MSWWKRSGERRPQLTAVSSMRGFWGLMTAYWRSEKWRQAWGLTAVIVILTALSAIASVWFAEASGRLVSAIAFLHTPPHEPTLKPILTSAATLAAIVIVQNVGFTAVRHFFSTTLHRKWREWLNARFNDALLDKKHTHFHLMAGAAEAEASDSLVPDNIDQRIQESIKGMAGGALGLAMGIAGVVLSVVFVGRKIIEASAPVNGLSFLGSFASACLTLVAVVAYVPIATLLAARLGRIMQRLDNRMQWAEGSYRAELTMLIRRSFYVAAARSERSQKGIHRRRYREIDGTWARLNILTAVYMAFENTYNLFGSRIVAYAPGLLPYFDGTITLQVYITGAELANTLINDGSWFIHVMPDIATLRANARRVTDVAEAIEDVQQPAVFHARTGLSDLHYGKQDPKLGLTIENLELMHPGSTMPFISTGELNLAPGEWTLLCGESGSGKSSLFKAINRLWPHGRGSVILPEGVRSLYAAQDVRLPSVSLKEAICLPDAPDVHPDAEVAIALKKAGLAEFADDLAEFGRGGQSWDQLFSGGQKQKVILARILLLKPKLIFLDEPTSALDKPAAVAFFQAIKDDCPDATVITITHDATPPKSATGDEFFDSVLSIDDGKAIKSPLVAVEARPVGPARVRFREQKRIS